MEAVPGSGAASFVKQVFQSIEFMVYVITGGPGFGKTTVLNLLGELGFPVCPESAREILSTITMEPGFDGRFVIPANFEEIIAWKRIDFLHSTAAGTLAFSDRGLPDQVAYSRYKKKEPSGFIDEKALNERYAPFVFVTPPWKEIYAGDEVRRESFEEASLLHGYILSSYRKYGYETIDLPLESPGRRVRFILDFLGV